MLYLFMSLEKANQQGFTLLFENTDIVKSFRAWYTHTCTYWIYTEGEVIMLLWWGENYGGTDILNKLLGYFESHNDQRYDVFIRVCVQHIFPHIFERESRHGLSLIYKHKLLIVFKSLLL